MSARIRHFLGFLTLAFALAAHASPREDFARYTQGIKGLDGRFEQKVFTARGQLKEDSTGTVALSAPRQFRWEYLKPNPQLIVADGDHVWIYDPDLEQVTVKDQSGQEAQSPLYILIDPTELDRRYLLADGGTRDGLKWLSLAPKHKGDDGDFKMAMLGFDGNDLRTMILTDNLGQRTQIDFSAWRRNPAFAKGTFAFTPPKGVDVVGEVTPAADVHPLKN
ncbi:MAG: outer membrane lipoprotein carrier protein LolA [Proteobacteria bacterium]|nr:outer membrane lipoprotein carrier protein LolA [Pseudomonadota bacterium]